MISFKAKLVKETIKANDPRYIELINRFLDDFNRTFKYIDRGMVEKRVKKNVKRIYIGGPTNFTEGVYIPLRKAIALRNLENKGVLNHELLHAVTRTKRTFSHLQFKPKYFFKKISEMDEGITEYVSYLMGVRNGQINCGVSNTGCYPGRTVVIHKLAQIFGEEIVVNSYIGVNQDLIKCINKYDKKTFDKLLKGISSIFAYNAQSRDFVTSKKKINLNQILDDLFNKERILQVNTLEDFKNNTIARATYEMDSIFDAYSYIHEKKRSSGELESQLSEQEIIDRRTDQVSVDLQILRDAIKSDWDNVQNNGNYNMGEVLKSCLDELEYTEQYGVLFNPMYNISKSDNQDSKNIEKEYLHNLKNQLIANSNRLTNQASTSDELNDDVPTK